MESEPKRMKTGHERRRICTHSGAFHADEALAIYMLTRHTKDYKGAEIVRSRDKEVWETCDALVDVGGEYIPEKHRFDHHQKGFEHTFEGFETKLSSAGLVYKHFGKEIIRSVLVDVELSEGTVDLFWRRLYLNFIEGVDGVDNGIDRYPRDIKPKYKNSSSLSGRVAALKPWWNAQRPKIFTTDDDWLMDRFLKAVLLTGEAFESRLLHMGKAWWPARSLVMDAYMERVMGGRVLVLRQFCPWKQHLADIEEEEKVGELVLYAIFPDSTGGWRIQGVPESPDSFVCRKYLPLPWRALRAEELDKLIPIAGSVFVHASGFIGGHTTFEGAMSMAKAAVEAKE